MKSKTLLSLGLVVFFVFLSIGINRNPAARAQTLPEEIRLIRKISSDEIGVSRPAGIAFSNSSEGFHLVKANAEGQRLPALLDVQHLDRFLHKGGSSLIDLALSDPINITFDPLNDRLLLYLSSAHSLATLRQNSAGKLIPDSLIVYDFQHIGLQSPQGLSIDPESGDLFVLDSSAGQIVKIIPEQDGSFTSAASISIDLSTAANQSFRGLAIDPSSGNFFLGSPVDLSLYEFSRDGKVVSAFDLTKFGIANPQGMTFAPSGDQTDDPAVSSLYLADSGAADMQSSGQMIELSLLEVELIDDFAFTSNQVAVRDLSLISPPIPDPTGISYVSTRNTLLVSDSEVEETVNGDSHFQGANVWELTLTGNLVSTANISSDNSDFPVSDEPAGVAYNPSNGHYYFVDDNTDLVYDVDPGPDMLLATGDDVLSSFDLRGFGSFDPEGITFDNLNNVIYLSDGVNAEIYKLSMEGALLGQFDVLQYGVQNPNSLDINPASQTLFILSHGTNVIIAETTLDGALLRTIDLSLIPLASPDGLAYAPASDESGNYSFFISDRGVDNNTGPNYIDGKIYEVTSPPLITPENQPILVDAGLDQTIILPANSVQLDAAVIDDGLPFPVSVNWSQVSGACLVTFSDNTAVDTSAAFPLTGRYELRLDASDSELNAWDTVVIDVHRQTPQIMFDAHVEARWDDAEETVLGDIRREGTQIELGEYQGPQKDGFRFNWLDIPAGAKIISAYIQFTSKAVDTDLSSLTIKGEATDNSLTFASTLFDISSRPTTAAAVQWTPDPWNTPDTQTTAQQTPDLSALLQEIVDRPGWLSGNSAAFIISGSGTRAIHAYESNPCLAPYLHVEWDWKVTSGDDTFSTAEDTPLVVPAPGVLVNDSDPDADPLTAVLVSAPAHGDLNLNPNGSFSYTPEGDFHGTDSFIYKATNGVLDSDPASVTISVTPVNDPPVAMNDSAVLVEDSQNNIIGVLGNDSDPDGDVLSVVAVGEASHGVATLNGGVIRYTPAPDFSGLDTFTYTLSDGVLTGEGAVSLTISGINDPPVAVDDAASLTVNSSDNLIDVLANDTDADTGAILSVTEVGSASHGSVAISAGAVLYTPDQDFFGQDSFSYTVSDGELDDQGQVTINIGNYAPDANADEYSMFINGVLSVTATHGVLKNDFDPDIGDSLSVVLVDGPAHGDLVLNEEGAFSYTPPPGFYGSIGFSYKVFDGQTYSAITPVVIQIWIPLFLPAISQ